ncbi:MAG: gliding motility-associated C-terminal domain-containing protein [Bacteroidetes bacterium]|nr:gliding motility-associated C-terminal domain-containing protein [Bacteroidota bacterium]
MKKQWLTFFLLALILNVKAQKIYTWKWIAGDSTPQANQIIVGELNTGAHQNNPGSLIGSSLWAIDSTSFYLYGGISNGSSNIMWQNKDSIWYWRSGTKSRVEEPKYSSLGLAKRSNTPGQRNHHCVWKDAYSNLWLFGGIAFNINHYEFKNDLWRWDGENWIWISGDSSGNSMPYYMKGKGAYPGARNGASFCTDKFGNFWLYGGTGIDAQGKTVMLNDLWLWNGNDWKWIAGDSIGNQHAEFNGIHNIGKPGGKENSALFFVNDTLWLFGGLTSTGINKTATLNDLWKWTGSNWIWVSGKKVTHSGIYSGIKQKFEPAARRWPAYTQANFDEAWVYGGSNGGGALSDLWKWNGKNWSLISGDSITNKPAIYSNNVNNKVSEIPGSRIYTAMAADQLGNLYMYGGYNDDKTRSDLWKFQTIKDTGIIKVYCENHFVTNTLDTPKQHSIYDYGKASITTVGKVKQFIVINNGNEQLSFPENAIAIIGTDSLSFIVEDQLIKKSLKPGDSTNFSIRFKPRAEGHAFGRIVITSNSGLNNKLNFILRGLGQEAKVTRINNISCSALKIQIKPFNAEHFSVYISQKPNAELLNNGVNYKHSLNYSKAPHLDSFSKVIYHGTKRNLEISNLISGRDYFLYVYPGSGSGNEIWYWKDSAQILSFSTRKSIWQDSISIFPDSSFYLCDERKCILSAYTPFNNLLWMDSNSISIRALYNSSITYFTTIDFDKCILSSDTLKISFFSKPKIDSIYTLHSKPWCFGTPLTFRAVSSEKIHYEWNTGSLYDSATVNKTGWVILYSRNSYNCKSKDSLLVAFMPPPQFNFIDTFAILRKQLEVNYKSNAQKLIWIIKNDSFDSLSKIINQAFENSYLNVKAISRYGCITNDSIPIKVISNKIQSNAFTPNGDGINDIWHYYSEFKNNLELTIYDRWGEKLLESKELKWDGSKNGIPLPIGTYYYLVKKQDQIISNGVIHILK